MLVVELVRHRHATCKPLDSRIDTDTFDARPITARLLNHCLWEHIGTYLYEKRNQTTSRHRHVLKRHVPCEQSDTDTRNGWSDTQTHSNL